MADQPIANPSPLPEPGAISKEAPRRTPRPPRVLQFVRRHDFAVLLCLMFGYYLWVDLVWHAIDRRTPRWDESHGLMISEHSYQNLQRGDVLTALSLRDVSNTKPGMVPFLSALSYFAIGNSWVLATMVANGCAMFTILVVLLRAGRDFCDSAGVGAVAFLCFCNVNAILSWCGYYQTDLPLTAAVCATVWLCWVIDRRGFTGRGLPILLAITIVFGMGIKHLYVVFVAAPLALLVVRAVVQLGWPPRFRRQARVYLIEWLIIGVMAGTSYHLLNVHILQEQIARSKNAALTGGIGDAQSAWSVFTQLVKVLPPKVWGILISVSLLWAIVARRWRMLYLALCIVGGFVGVGYTASWPMAYYFIPILPLGIFIAVAVLGLPLPGSNKFVEVVLRARSIVVVLLLVVLAVKYSGNRLGTRNLARVAWYTPVLLKNFGTFTASPLTNSKYWEVTYIDGNEAPLPYPHAWQVEEFLGEIEGRIKLLPPGRPLVLLYLTGSYEWMTDEFGRYQIRKRHLIDKLHMTSAVPPGKTPEQVLADFDFVILKTGKAMKIDFYSAQWGQDFQKLVDGMTSNDYANLKAAGFEPLLKRDLPDGSEGSVWMSTRRMQELRPS